MIFKKKDFITF